MNFKPEVHEGLTYILVPCSEHSNIKVHRLANLIKCDQCIAYYECYRCDNMYMS